VKLSVRVPFLLAVAMLVAWHGLLLSTPHSHAENAVPQEELVCSASHPSSQESHLHEAGQLLTPHTCLACLAGSNFAAMGGASIIEMTTVVSGASVVSATDCRFETLAHLADLRAPPFAV
jgi:hypothetical protein